MTSTPFNIGIAEGKRPTSRVLCPPGGKHTDIFSMDPEPPRYGKRQGFQVQAAQTSEEATATNGSITANDKAQPDTPEVRNTSSEALPETIPETKSQTSVTPESASPVQTAEPQSVASAPIKAAMPDSETVTTTKRVRVPPGGFSSKLW